MIEEAVCPLYRVEAAVSVCETAQRQQSTAQFERRLRMLHLSSGDGQYWQIPAEFEAVSRLNLFESHPISEDAFSRQFRKSNIVNPCHDTEDMTLTVFR